MDAVAIFDIQTERDRQDAKWGEQNHDDDKWLAILMEEVGEVAKAMLECGPAGGSFIAKGEIDAELTQVAAVALAWMECRNRRRRHWGMVAPDPVAG